MRYCFSASLVARQSTRRRLGLALLVALFVCGLSWVSEARAASYPVSQGYWASSSYSVYSYDPATMCSKITAAANADNNTPKNWTFVSWATISATQIYCTINGGSPAQDRYFYGNKVQNGTCAPGDTLSGSTCTVPTDCTAPSVKNAYIGASVQGTATSLPSTICIQGCAYNAGSVGVQVGTSYASDIGSGTGATCTGANYDSIDTTTKKTDPPSLVSCQKQGKVYGTVNGVGICAAAGTIPNSTVQQQSTSTTQATSASGVQAAAQTTGENTTVSNVNGVPMVTKVVTNPDGSKSTTTQDQPSFCAQNPNAQVCKESQSNVSGGGDCSSAPVCQGDAVQCAMVNQQWHTRCDSNQANAQSDLGSQILAGNDPLKNPAASSERIVHNISSSIDQTAFLSGGGGLADKVVTVHGNAITLPFSKLNQYLVWLGHIFVVISLIGGLRIVLGGFK